MKLASRFKDTIDIAALEDAGKLSIATKLAAEEGGEVAVKRAQLLRDINGVQQNLVENADRLKRLIMDIEASQAE